MGKHIKELVIYRQMHQTLYIKGLFYEFYVIIVAKCDQNCIMHGHGQPRGIHKQRQMNNGGGDQKPIIGVNYLLVINESIRGLKNY